MEAALCIRVPTSLGETKIFNKYSKELSASEHSLLVMLNYTAQSTGEKLQFLEVSIPKAL